MLLSAVSVLVVAQPSSKVPEGLMNYPVCIYIGSKLTIKTQIYEIIIYSATCFDPMRSSGRYLNILGNYTYHIMEDRPHVLQIMYNPVSVHSVQD